MEFSEDTLFEGVIVKRGNEDAPAVGEVLIYEQDGVIGVSVPVGTAIRYDDSAYSYEVNFPRPVTR